VGVDPGPKYRGEVFDPGRQGSHAKRNANPACGSAYLLWDHPPRHHEMSAGSRSLTLSRGAAARTVNKGLELARRLQPRPER